MMLQTLLQVTLWNGGDLYTNVRMINDIIFCGTLGLQLAWLSKQEGVNPHKNELHVYSVLY